MFKAIVFAVAVLLIWTTRNYANGSEVGFEAGTIFPLQSSKVRLVSEQVVINLSGEIPGSEGMVWCWYTLENLSDDPTTFTMAFITALAYSGVPWDVSGYRSASLGARLRGRQLPIQIIPVDPERWRSVLEAPPDSLPAWDIELGGRESAKLEVNYQASWSGGSDGPSVGRTFTYYARPAALWADVIREATITIRLGEPLALLLKCQESGDSCVTFRASPPGYTWFSGGLKWEFRDWEPDSDFRVSLDWISDED